MSAQLKHEIESELLELHNSATFNLKLKRVIRSGQFPLSLLVNEDRIKIERLKRIRKTMQTLGY